LDAVAIITLLTVGDHCIPTREQTKFDGGRHAWRIENVEL